MTDNCLKCPDKCDGHFSFSLETLTSVTVVAWADLDPNTSIPCAYAHGIEVFGSI